MLVTIDPKKTLHEFTKTIQLKLLLEGYLTEKNKIFYLNARQKQLNVNRIIQLLFRHHDGKHIQGVSVSRRMA
jgi:hypothetical protein